MKVELEIISDRLPTEADGWFVLAWYPDKKRWDAVPQHIVESGQVWMRQPPPPKPPIDTSLAASIDRLYNWLDDGTKITEYDEPELESVLCDVDRIIEAARKWDRQERRLRDWSDAQQSNDPDGVGEGWRLLKDGEVIQAGDEVYVWPLEEWKKSFATGFKIPTGERGYRRRIEAEQ